MQLKKVVALVALGVAGAFVACTLNPQPLPPSDANEGSSFGDDASARADAGGGVFTPGTAVDAASPTPPDNADAGTGSGDGGGDAGDAGGDAGDAGDSG
jgi:hypothetical protein